MTFKRPPLSNAEIQQLWDQISDAEEKGDPEILIRNWKLNAILSELDNLRKEGGSMPEEKTALEREEEKHRDLLGFNRSLNRWKPVTSGQ